MKKYILVLLISILLITTASAEYYSYQQEQKKEFSEADIRKIVKSEILKDKKEQYLKLGAEIRRMEHEMTRGY